MYIEAQVARSNPNFGIKSNSFYLIQPIDGPDERSATIADRIRQMRRQMRQEVAIPGCSLLIWSSPVNAQKLRIDFGIEYLLDRTGPSTFLTGGT